MRRFAPLEESSILGPGLTIGGVSLRIHCEDDSFLDQVRDRYAGFVVLAPDDPDAPAWDLHFTVQEDLLPGSEVTPTVERTDDGFQIHRRDFQATLRMDDHTLQGSVARSMYSFDSLLRVFFTLLLNELDGLLVHGSSVVEGGRAFLFYGVSGSGKTTTTILSEPRIILSDELTLVRWIDGEYRAFGTPFWGELQKNGENVNVPLECLSLLVKDPEVYLEDQTPRQALRSLLPCILFFSNEPEQVNRVVERAVHLVETVPVGALHFRKDDSFWKLFSY
jgi:hypothetical protein